jgi:hypothetical protein
MRETERLVRRVVSNAGHCPFDVDRLVDLFADFGQRPVDAYFILVDLEELFKIHIPDARFVGARCIEQLTNLVESLLSNSDDSRDWRWELPEVKYALELARSH